MSKCHLCHKQIPAGYSCIIMCPMCLKYIEAHEECLRKTYMLDLVREILVDDQTNDDFPW